MKRVLFSYEMKEVDNSSKIPQIVLMENAGKGVAENIRSFGNSFIILCGSGNNGGDGFVVARWLKKYKKNVKVIIFDENIKTNEARINFELLKAFDIEIEMFNEKKFSINADVVVDGIFGIGFKGKLEGKYYKCIEIVNSSNAKKISLDIPSGISADDGSISNIAFKSDITYTFASEKLGHFLFEGKIYSGKVEIVDIGIEEKLLENKGFLYLEEDDVINLLPKYIGYENKKDKGRVLIIGGSKDYVGAVILNIFGAISSGVGLIYCAIPKSIYPYIVGKVPESIVIPIEDENGYFSRRSFEDLLSKNLNFDSLVVGSGISRNEYTKQFMSEVLNLNIPKIIDADGIWAISDKIELLDEKTIITPHPGEMSFIISKEPKEIDRKRIEVSMNFSKKYKPVLLLKGNPSVIVQNNYRFLNIWGDERLARGGSGDILSGLIGGFLAQKVSPIYSAVISSYLHSRSCEFFDKLTFKPSDIPKGIELLIKKIK
ncbi:MAG: NAD(P)H-hydrate dehydratase [candidate division WOR-3 bacterium]|nr:NAD(P)H-hydrate dehydratase [candidate division WOR-3 bacterium]MCX7948083.1 NAD(P)H-hydrate dehydratase [candidate division WOR-3 bacterium]MDW8150979.1 NAD(P)H-hydrate dehydratase [candidate division WOR-3 bacterium]